MDDSLQDVYSKQLRQSHGFPLRIPEPSSALPQSYQDGGLQIGDVGYVDRNGVFNVLFNIRRSPDHELHAQRALPAGFYPIDLDESTEINIIANSIPHGCVISSTSIRREVPPKNPSVLYEFIPSTATGAILILPSGAICHELRDKEKFRRVAMEQGRDWCAFARRDSLYLITGSYKARAWTLGSFRNAPGPSEARIKVVRGDENAGLYRWDPSFSVDWRCASGPCNTDDPQNQTVLISGFSITARWWAPAPVVEVVPEQRRTAFIKVIRLLILMWLHQLRGTHQLRIDHEPRLSEPFHPSGAINRFLLDKHPEAEVAITHDDQWISMLEEKELTYDDMAQEDRLVAFLSERCYSGSVAMWNENGAVSLMSKRPRHVTIARQHASPSRPVVQPPRALEGFSRSKLSKYDFQTIITRIRAEDINLGLQRLPVGFFIGLQFDGATRRTKSKPVSVNESVVEWDDQILLPSDQSMNVIVKICASFELNPTLGSGETLHVFYTTVGELLSNSQAFTFSQEDGKASPWCSSLLVVAERRVFNHFGADLNPVDTNSVDLSRTTDLGHDALLRFYKDYQKEDLDSCLGHFKHATDICPADHPCRAVVLSNLATAECLGCQVEGTNLVSTISRYRGSLELRPVGHPDRPATLLRLAQALLCRYGEQGCEDSITLEIEEHIKEIQASCDVCTHIHRAAKLISQSYQTYRVIKSGALADLDKLIPELKRAVQMPPEGHFDMLDRLNNLSVTLSRRFEVKADRGDLEDVNAAISHLEDALRSTPDGHPQKPRYLHSLGHSFFLRFNRRGELGDLDQAVSRFKDAVRLISDRHPDRPLYLYSLANSLLLRFQRRDDLDDIDQATLRLGDVVRLTPDGDNKKAGYLHDLGNSCFARFRRRGDNSDLAQGISSLAEVIQRTPEAQSVRAGYVKSLHSSFRICCERLDGNMDLARVDAKLRGARAEDILACLQDYKRSYPSPGPLQSFLSISPNDPSHLPDRLVSFQTDQVTDRGDSSPGPSHDHYPINYATSITAPVRSRVASKGRDGDTIIAVMGPTGSGKTNLINTIIGKTEQRSAGKLRSDTQGITPYTVERNGKRLVCVDTPGFDDTYRTDFEILTLIADWLKQDYEYGTTLDGLIYLHRITDNRMTGSAYKNLQIFGRVCGNAAAHRVRLVTTMWDLTGDRGTAEQREAQLQKEFWVELISAGALVKRFENTYHSAWAIVSELMGLGGQGEPLLLQEELVDQQKRLNETEAGKALYSQLQRLLADQKETLRRLTADASQATNPSLATSLQEEYDRINERLQKTLEEIQAMKMPLSWHNTLWLFGRKSRADAIKLERL